MIRASPCSFLSPPANTICACDFFLLMPAMKRSRWGSEDSGGETALSLSVYRMAGEEVL